jgi:hypothetical protein
MTATHAVGTSALPAALVDVLESLGIDPANAVVRRGGLAGAHTYLVLPSLRTPNLLVPLAASGAVVVEERAARGLRHRVVRRALTAALRSGTLSAAPVPRLHVDDPSLTELTDWLTDGRPGSARLGIMLGPARANRKAVIRVLAEDGETLGFAKVGSTPLTRELVRAEARNLHLLSAEPPTSFRIPDVLRFRDEEAMTVLLTSPLARTAERRQPADLPHRETRDLFRRHEDDSTPLEALELFSPATFPRPAGPDGADLAGYRDRLMTVAGSRRLPVGDSHGDWAPQNMAVGSNGLSVWDWERYASGVPQGLDAIHFEATRVDTRSDAVHRSEARLLQGLPDALQRCGLDPATAPVLLCLYLLWVSRRYQADLALVPSDSTRSRLRWATHLLETQLRMLESDLRSNGTERP